jgi:hypothetical protein
MWLCVSYLQRSDFNLDFYVGLGLDQFAELGILASVIQR